MWVSDILLTFRSFSPGDKKTHQPEETGVMRKLNSITKAVGSISTFFLIISLEPVCLQRNQQKDGERDKVLPCFPPFLQLAG